MNINRPVELTPGNMHRFQSFIVFEPASTRVQEGDILIKGDQVQELYNHLFQKLSSDESIQSQIILNRVNKIGQMLELLTSFDNVILSKFFDRIWRRYNYISNIGEMFLDMPTFLHYFPDYKTQQKELLAVRIDEDEDEEVDVDDGETEKENTEQENSEEVTEA
ncbi:hypothetical protein ACFL96_00545 [Thermoproteota archaeon]